MSNSLRSAWFSLRAFLRGFVGVRGPNDIVLVADHLDCCDPAFSNESHPLNTTPQRPTPAEVRAALASRAAGRANCC